MVAAARCQKAPNNALMGFEKFLSVLICCCFAFGKGRGWLFLHGKIWCKERLDEMLVLNKAKISSRTSDITEVRNRKC